MSHFQTRVKNLFLPSGKNFFSRRPFGRSQLVGANGFMRLFDPTVKHFSAKKILWIYALLTDYSINIPKRHRKMFAFFPKQHAAPQKSPATGNAGMGPSQRIHLPVFPHVS